MLVVSLGKLQKERTESRNEEPSAKRSAAIFPESLPVRQKRFHGARVAAEKLGLTMGFFSSSSASNSTVADTKRASQACAYRAVLCSTLAATLPKIEVRPLQQQPVSTNEKKMAEIISPTLDR